MHGDRHGQRVVGDENVVEQADGKVPFQCAAIVAEPDLVVLFDVALKVFLDLYGGRKLRVKFKTFSLSQ